MPTKSKAQEKLMRAVANNPKFAKQDRLQVKPAQFIKHAKNY